MAEVAYKPIGKINPKNADIIKLQIPPYDDVGISYKGYSKQRISETEWKLNPQDTRHITMSITSGAFGSTLFTRPNNTKTFYCTGIQFRWKLPGGIFPNQFHLADVDINGSASIRLYEYALGTGEKDFFLSFLNCPRKFSGNRIDLYTEGSLSAGEYVYVQLFGWEE